MSESKGSTGRGGHDVSDEPRVPKGNGDESGRWMAAAERLKLVGKFQQIPQNKANAGYYNFGTPKYGIAQYALPETARTLELVGKIWRAQGEPPFGVGNISLMDGRAFDGHTDHGEGRGVDIRPLRQDERQEPVSYKDPAYDREATQKLVDLLWATGRVEQILFNDPGIVGATEWDKDKPPGKKPHDIHLHARMKLP